MYDDKNNKLKIYTVSKYCILEVLGNNYFLPTFLRVTTQVQFEVWRMKKETGRKEINILQSHKKMEGCSKQNLINHQQSIKKGCFNIKKKVHQISFK